MERYDVVCSLGVLNLLKPTVIEKKITTVHGRAMVSGFTRLKWCVANSAISSGNNSLINSHKVIGVKLITNTNVVIADILLFKIDLMFSLLNRNDSASNSGTPITIIKWKILVPGP